MKTYATLAMITQNLHLLHMSKQSNYWVTQHVCYKDTGHFPYTLAGIYWTGILIGYTFIYSFLFYNYFGVIRHKNRSVHDSSNVILLWYRSIHLTAIIWVLYVILETETQCFTSRYVHASYLRYKNSTLFFQLKEIYPQGKSYISQA